MNIIAARRIGYTERCGPMTFGRLPMTREHFAIYHGSAIHFHSPNAWQWSIDQDPTTSQPIFQPCHIATSQNKQLKICYHCCFCTHVKTHSETCKTTITHNYPINPATNLHDLIHDNTNTFTKQAEHMPSLPCNASHRACILEMHGARDGDNSQCRAASSYTALFHGNAAASIQWKITGSGMQSDHFPMSDAHS